MADKARATWQQAFVATNTLTLGYNAWCGFLAGERGVVVCSLRSPLLGLTDESFKTDDVPRSRLTPFLNAWLAAPNTVILNHHHINSHILQGVDHYHPETDAILLLESGKHASFLYLRNLPIPLSQCYEVVRKRWDDFKPLEPDFPNYNYFSLT